MAEVTVSNRRLTTRGRYLTETGTITTDADAADFFFYTRVGTILFWKFCGSDSADIMADVRPNSITDSATEDDPGAMYVDELLGSGDEQYHYEVTGKG